MSMLRNLIVRCSMFHDRAERAAAELREILAHHGLIADIRVTSDEALADMCIRRIDRAAQTGL